MRVAVLYPVGVFYDGSHYTTNAYQHYQFSYLRPHVDEFDLVALLKHTRSQKGSEVMRLSGIRVLGLPYCANGLELHITKLPLWLPLLVLLLWRHRREWDRVLLYDLALPNQVAYLCCRLFGLRAVLLLGGRYADGFWQAHKDKPLPLRVLARAYSWWTQRVENHLVRRLPTLADYIPEGLQDRGRPTPQGHFSLYVGAMIDDHDLEPSAPPLSRWEDPAAVRGPSRAHQGI